MRKKLGGIEVNVSTVPAFMGHEELAIPMLARDCCTHAPRPGQGRVRHALSPDFDFDCLAGTAVAGYLAGYDRDLIPIRFESVWLDPWGELEGVRVPEIGAALDKLGKAFAFFLETSPAPLQDAYISRCRLVSRERLPDFHSRMDVPSATAQTVTARAALAAFFETHAREPDYGALYGDYFNSRDRLRYGDDEYWGVGCAVWLEVEGVVRAWTRVTYAPK